jgi:hypothetical protein
MSSPRSQRLIAFSVDAGGGSGFWTCPADHVTLVKSVLAYNSSTASVSLNITFFATGTAIQTTLHAAAIGAGASFDHEFLVVLNPGDTVGMAFSGGPASAWLSGAVLVGANQFPPAVRELPTQLPGDQVRPQPLPSSPGMPQPV